LPVPAAAAPTSGNSFTLAPAGDAATSSLDNTPDDAQLDLLDPAVYAHLSKLVGTQIDFANDPSITEIDLSAQTGELLITEPGTYRIQGNPEANPENENHIIINAAPDADVKLILFNATIISGYNTASAVYVRQAGTVSLFSPAGSHNEIKGNDDQATIRSNADLVIYGPGELTVWGPRSHAGQIYSSQGVLIDQTTLHVTGTMSPAIAAGQYVVQQGGSIDVLTGVDGITAIEPAGKVAILGGETLIHAGGTGIVANTSVLIDGGDYYHLPSFPEGTTTSSLDIQAGTGIEAPLVVLGEAGEVVSIQADRAGILASGTANVPNALVIAGDDADLVVIAGGVGLHSGGVIRQTAGNAVVQAHSSPLNAESGLQLDGGTMLATGGTVPSEFNRRTHQRWLVTPLDPQLEPGSGLTITDADGAEVTRLDSSEKLAKWLLFSSPDLASNATYWVNFNNQQFAVPTH